MAWTLPCAAPIRHLFSGMMAVKTFIDASTPFGRYAERLLRTERIVWLTTVAADGTPQPNAVWFIWEGDTALMYSIPNQAKLRNIARNPNVALNLDSKKHGDGIVRSEERRVGRGVGRGVGSE